MLQYCPLASGSKGNCLLVRTPSTHLLVDCGISLRSLQKRLAILGLTIDCLDAILITHEHTDHIQGLRALLRKRDIPVLCNRETAVAISQILREPIPCHLFTTCESFEWRDLHCMPFSVSHDAMDPVGFSLTWQNERLGICTDLGFVAATIPAFLQTCDLLYVEANHDPELVQQSKRPPVYKQRVLSRLGHLSNEACGELLSQVWHEKLRHVYLAHLSQDCNRPEIALETVRRVLMAKQPQSSHLEIDVAFQDIPGALVSIKERQWFKMTQEDVAIENLEEADLSPH